MHETFAYRIASVSLSLSLSAYFKLRTAGRIFMKFDVDVMPLEAIPDSYFLISYNE
jgi:hypothetical protein